MFLNIKILNIVLNNISNFYNISVLWYKNNTGNFIFNNYSLNINSILTWKSSKINNNEVCNSGGGTPLPLHPYHLVDQSPWPLALSGVLLSLTLSAALSFHGYVMGDLLLTCSFILLVWGMSLWFKDVISEASYLGAHTDKVQKGISLGIVLFIISEVFFFLSIFWAYFHSSLAPAIELGGEWPPKGIEPVDASEVPTANTTILLSSGSAVTVSHHSLVNQLIDWANYGSVATILLAILFTGLQVLEYLGVSYTITDSVFGSTFFMATGLMWDPFVYIIISLSNWIKTRIITQEYTVVNEIDIFNAPNRVVNNLKDMDYTNTINPYWITGFSDGESCFVLKFHETDKRKVGWSVIPTFSIELHIRDLYVLEKIHNFFKVGSISKRKNRNTAVYAVQSVDALNNVIIPHFIKYSLLTEKQRDFKLFCMGIDIVNKKEHLILPGLKKLISIRESMNKKSLGNLNEYLKVDTSINKILDINKEILDPYWLVGFVDAEGCFYIKPNKSKSELRRDRYSLVFTISQHSRDLLLLNNIVDYLQCGVIETPNGRNEGRYIVYKFNDHLEKIMPFFEKFNLVTVKQLDFLDYKKAASLLKKKSLITEEDLFNIQFIKSGMNKNRFNI
jgi:cytochrome c oxidase subunit 3